MIRALTHRSRPAEHVPVLQRSRDWRQPAALQHCRAQTILATRVGRRARGQ